MTAHDEPNSHLSLSSLQKSQKNSGPDVAIVVVVDFDYDQKNDNL